MKKTISGKEYYLPTNLSSEQEEIYCHIIDWKRKNITSERGWDEKKEHEYDAFFPEGSSIYAMIYKPILPRLEEMQGGDFAYKPHRFAGSAVSSQTACINLFMPLLLSKEANRILPKIPGCPSDFKKIDKDKLFQGFCFEYWGQNIKKGRGVLNDHDPNAGTDADVAIAYLNKNNEHCLWLIEHKLSEKEFTECGGYKSDKNMLKTNCDGYSLKEIAADPKKCHYHAIGYKYWDLFKENYCKYKGKNECKGCPFKGGLNQLWRNQMLAFALQKTGEYKTVTFSVCRHAKNSMLNESIALYKALISNDDMFSTFTNYDVMDAITDPDQELSKWKKWYEEVYCF
ncbi:MAG: hypothetical protein LUI04_06120 [Porphyromonadaceae bacterium]|nr:hypothetical protein [Porphyromonadaceae bacterium]